MLSLPASNFLLLSIEQFDDGGDNDYNSDDRFIVGSYYYKSKNSIRILFSSTRERERDMRNSCKLRYSTPKASNRTAGSNVIKNMQIS